MRLVLLLIAVMSATAPAMAQQPAVSSTGADRSPAQDADPSAALSRIRERLKRQETSRLRNLDVTPDFSVQIEAQARIDEIMSKLDFKTGPAPAGGLYGYEQQQRLFNPTDRPLQQPYAAFSGGELITVAMENLIARYLGGPLVKALSAAERSRAEAKAREEVDVAVAEYCAARSDRDSITLCTSRQR